MADIATPSPAGRPRLDTLFARVGAPAEASETLPPVCYTDPDLLAREREAIFLKAWLGIGRADRWQRDGDFTALDVAGVPVVVLRDRNDGLRAYANTCRHRGAKLLAGSGRRHMITCPFHGWSYGLDGKLRKAPEMDKTLDFDCADFGLHSFSVVVREGFAFLCLAEDPPDIDALLGDFPSLHRDWALADLVSTRRRDFEVACNWKSFLEVFNEYYHLPFVHARSVGELYAPPEDADAVIGSYSSQFGATEGTGGLREDDQDQALPTIPSLEGRNRSGARYSWIFPNMTFGAGSDMVWIYEVLPIAPDRTLVGMTACFHPDTIGAPEFDDKAPHYYKRLDDIIAEDIPLLERQQAGMASPFAKAGRFCHLEPSVANFACWYAKQMTA